MGKGCREDDKKNKEGGMSGEKEDDDYAANPSQHHGKKKKGVKNPQPSWERTYKRYKNEAAVKKER